MSCTVIEYKTKLITTVDTQLRLAPLPPNVRKPTVYTITTAAAAAIDDEEIAVAPTPVDLWPGDTLEFDKGLPTATIAQVASITATGSTTVAVAPLEGVIANGATAESIGSVYIAGVTDASPPSSPKIIPTSNYLSGAGAESAVTGTNRQLNMTFDRVESDPGGKLLLDILYIDELYDREIYAIYQRPNGERYEGAAIPTTGDQSGPVQDKATMTVNLQYQGCSFKFTHARNAAAIAWPTA